MRNLYLTAALAMVAMGASAQYTCNPEVSTVLKKGKVSKVWTCFIDEASVNELKKQGADIVVCQPNNETINFYVWPNGDSFTAGDSSNPGGGMHFDGYTSLNVANLGWSGAGLNIAAEPGADMTAWNDDTRFHLAYMSNGAAPAGVQIVIADGEAWGSKPAKVSFGESFESAPVVAPRSSDDWQGIDMSFADLKKVFPSFDYKAVSNWNGNIFSVLAGAVTGTNISLDAVYYYNLGTTGVEAVADEAAWLVSSKTINLNGGNGIELFNLQGQLVKATEGCVLGLDGLQAGVYVARHGQSARKVVVK